MVRIGPKNFLAHFLSFFIYALLNAVNYAQRFCQRKDLIKIYICVKFHQDSICGCEVKNFCINSASMKWPLFGVFWVITPPNYCSILLKSCSEVVVSNKTNTVFENSYKILNFSLNGRHLKFAVLFHFGTQFTTGNPKILLKTKISAKTTSLRISTNVSPRSQKNHRILVKILT